MFLGQCRNFAIPCECDRGRAFLTQGRRTGERVDGQDNSEGSKGIYLVGESIYRPRRGSRHIVIGWIEKSDILPLAIRPQSQRRKFYFTRVKVE